MHKNILTNTKIMPYLFLLPFILFFLIFRLWPILWSFFISFFSYNGTNVFEFVGLKNYISLVKDGTFLTAVWNTLFIVIVYNVCLLYTSNSTAP